MNTHIRIRYEYFPIGKSQIRGNFSNEFILLISLNFAETIHDEMLITRNQASLYLISNFLPTVCCVSTFRLKKKKIKK